MKLEAFFDDEMGPSTELLKRLEVKPWRKQIERVLDAYIGECELYRREHKALQDQVNEIARAVAELRKA